MLRRSRTLPGLVFAVATTVLLAGCETEADRPADTGMDTLPEQPLTTDRDQPQEVYEARLEARDGSGVTGTATVAVQDNELQVTVAATGFEPNTRVPQHIHMNSTCEEPGGIMLNLDENLSAAGEAEPRGDAYPETDDQGRLQYEASRSLDELREHMREHGGAEADTMAGMQTDTMAGAGAQMMDLGNRVVNLHGENMQSISCGALESTGQMGQMGQPGQPGQPGPGQTPQ